MPLPLGLINDRIGGFLPRTTIELGWASSEGEESLNDPIDLKASPVATKGEKTHRLMMCNALA